MNPIGVDTVIADTIAESNADAVKKARVAAAIEKVLLCRKEIQEEQDQEYDRRQQMRSMRYVESLMVGQQRAYRVSQHTDGIMTFISTFSSVATRMVKSGAITEEHQIVILLIALPEECRSGQVWEFGRAIDDPSTFRGQFLKVVAAAVRYYKSKVLRAKMQGKYEELFESQRAETTIQCPCAEVAVPEESIYAVSIEPKIQESTTVPEKNAEKVPPPRQHIGEYRAAMR